MRAYLCKSEEGGLIRGGPAGFAGEQSAEGKKNTNQLHFQLIKVMQEIIKSLQVRSRAHQLPPFQVYRDLCRCLWPFVWREAAAAEVESERHLILLQFISSKLLYLANTTCGVWLCADCGGFLRIESILLLPVLLLCRF